MNEIYKNRKKTTKVKTRSRNIKNDLNNHLTTYAYNSNDLIIANETYKTQINNLSKYFSLTLIIKKQFMIKFLILIKQFQKLILN